MKGAYRMGHVRSIGRPSTRLFTNYKTVIVIGAILIATSVAGIFLDKNPEPWLGAYRMFQLAGGVVMIGIGMFWKMLRKHMKIARSKPSLHY